MAYLAWKSHRKATRPRFVTTAHGLYRTNRYSEIMTRGRTSDRDFRDNSRVSSEEFQHVWKTTGSGPSQWALIKISSHAGFQPDDAWIANWFQEFPQLRGCPVISLIGRIVRLKGHLDLIEIVDQIRTDIPEIKALIVGNEDPRRAAYANEIHKQHCRSRSLQNTSFSPGKQREMSARFMRFPTSYWA